MARDDRGFTRIQELAYELRVADAMTAAVETIGPENTVRDLAQRLREMKISGMPVCDKEELVGMMSIEDLINCLMEGELGCEVRHRMTRDVVALYADEPLTRAVEKFEKTGFGRFPVLERKSGKVVGIVTKGDIVRCLLKKLEIDYREEEVRRHRVSRLFDDLEADSLRLILRYRVEGGDFTTAGQRSSRLKRNLTRLGFHPEMRRRAAIAAYEAEMNIVIFTPGGELKVCAEPGRITVEAADRGPGIADVELAMKPGYSSAPGWVRELGFGAGMGLPNIKSCSDEMTLETRPGEGTRLRFVVEPRS